MANAESVMRELHAKPTWIEDIEDVACVNPSERLRYQRWFLLVHNVVSSLVLAILVDYRVWRVGDSSLSWFEILGVVGGFVSLYTTMQGYVGAVLLNAMLYFKRRRDAADGAVSLPARRRELSSSELCSATRELGASDSMWGSDFEAV